MAAGVQITFLIAHGFSITKSAPDFYCETPYILCMTAFLLVLKKVKNKWKKSQSNVNSLSTDFSILIKFC